MTTLTTPAGIPALAQSSASIKEVRGVISAGLRTIVLPAEMAGRIFHMAICSG
jgi:CII-binding regulator of phage lambda lysogenization HflD